MAEDLGSIKIVFPDLLGGGASTGPLPKSGAPSAGGVSGPGSFVQTIAGTATALGNTFSTLTAVVGDFVGKLSDYANTVQSIISRSVSGIIEGGKYSGAVQMQAALIKVQSTLDLMAQGQMLAPLYTLVLRWYRELMAALAPIRAAISAIFASIGGVLIVAVKALTPLILNVTKAVVVGIAKITEYLAKQSGGTVSTVSWGALAGGSLLTLLGLAGFFGAGPLGSLGMIGLGTSLGLGATAMSAGAAGLSISSEWESVKAELAKVSPALLKILEQIEKGNRQRSLQSPNAWVNQQLFDLTSHVTAKRDPQYGVGTLGTP